MAIKLRQPNMIQPLLVAAGDKLTRVWSYFEKLISKPWKIKKGI